MSHTLRPMLRTDLERVQAIQRQHAPGTPASEWLPVAEQAIDENTDTPLAFVSEVEGGRITGYILGAIRSWEFGSPPAGWVIGIGVDIEHQHSGAGADLLRQLLRSFAARKVGAARTMVRREDIQVLRFFRTAGFNIGPYTELEMELEP